jgi:hypothetical protein
MIKYSLEDISLSFECHDYFLIVSEFISSQVCDNACTIIMKFVCGIWKSSPKLHKREYAIPA